MSDRYCLRLYLACAAKSNAVYSAYNQAMARLDVAAGYELSPELDQPSLPTERITFGGSAREHAANLYAVWLSQRAQRFYQAQSDRTKADIQKYFGSSLSGALLDVPLRYPMERLNNRLTIGNL